MHNKFSDVEKAIITTWPILGIGMGLLVAALFETNFAAAGSIGLFAGATVDYVLFFEPRRRKYGLFPEVEEVDNSTQDENDEGKPELSQCIKDHFDAERAIPRSGIEFRNGQGEAAGMPGENSFKSTEMAPQREIASEDQGFAADAFDAGSSEEREDEREAQDQTSAHYTRANEIHSTYHDEYENEKTRGPKAWMTPTRMPILLAGAWLFISGYISDRDFGFARVGTDHFPLSFLTLLPIVFLIGLSGFFGILFSEPKETLERSAVENATLLINLLKVFAGWGVGLYVIFLRG